MATIKRKPVPIYTTSGDFTAFLVYPMIYDLSGEWIGFMTKDRDVYSVHGTYAGWLSDDPRILRKKSYDYSKPKLVPPQKPKRLSAPASMALAPMMPGLSYDTIDVLEDDPDSLPTSDAGEMLEDLN